MPIKRRTFLAATATGLAASAVGGVIAPQIAQAATWKKRLTGADMPTSSRWQVAGTDLGIPYVLENGSIGYLFGDTFNSPWPEQQNNDWRSPVMLRSAVHPNAAGGIVFDSAARVVGNGRALEIMKNGHNGIGIDNLWEVTVIPNDGISFPETGRQLVSYMSIEHWNPGPRYSLWRSRYAGIAFTDNGNDFVRTNLKWFNDADNADPFQMWTMQRMGDYVYIHSVRAGRQDGPMMLRRVPWDRLFNPESYEGFGWNGTNWGWGRPCPPALTGRFGEPSVRRLSNGIWVMVYLNAATGNIVSRWAYGPDTGWSNEKVQVTYAQEPALYGGFIHPWSGSAANELHLMVSKWTRDQANNSTAYHVSQYVGTV